MEQKQQILNSSFALFMRYGIKSVTMDDIAKELGISKKTLYQHVRNKADLIEQIAQQHLCEEEEVMTHIRSTSSDALEEMLRIGKYVVDKLQAVSHTALYDLRKYYSSTWKQMETQMKQQVYSIISENLERGIRQGIYRAELKPDIIARLYIGKSLLIADDDWFDPETYSVASLQAVFINYHMHGILSAKGRQLLEKHLAAERQQDNKDLTPN